MKSHLDELEQATKRLLSVLQAREVGLASWWMMLHSCADEVRDKLPPSSEPKPIKQSNP
jgi:hypothetical protein